MEIVEIDVLDGRGVIQVAVADYLAAVRLRDFVSEATATFRSFGIPIRRPRNVRYAEVLADLKTALANIDLTIAAIEDSPDLLGNAKANESLDGPTLDAPVENKDVNLSFAGNGKVSVPVSSILNSAAVQRQVSGVKQIESAQKEPPALWPNSNPAKSP